MAVQATQINGETVQAIGSRAKFFVAAESSWGTAPVTATRQVRLIPGESLDQNMAIYRSKQIRGDRMHNQQVRGSMDPGGSLPFELSADGWNWALFNLLLPSSVTTTGPTGTLVDPVSAPTGSQSGNIGATLSAGTYYYVYTGTNSLGETNISPVSSAFVASGGGLGFNGTVTSISGTTTYNVYRGTSASGPFNYVLSISGTTAFVDRGGPIGAQAPVENSTGQLYTHVLNAGTTGTPLPIGFSLEKQFLDLGTPVYELIKGCRINKMTLSFGIDAIPTGNFDILAREFVAGTSVNFTNSPTIESIAPYTGAYIGVYEAGSNNQLGLCTSLQLTIDNAYRQRNGFVIGSNLRQNLKTGTRMTDFSGQFMFQDLNLYNKAINGTNTVIKVQATMPAGDGRGYSHTFLLGTAQFTPNQSAPRVHDDGPLEIALRGEALPDQATGTDVQCTIVTSESNITN